MRLLLHAGTEKTGSSYLQTAFSSRARSLADIGVFFPADRFATGDPFGGVQGDGGFMSVLFARRDYDEFVRRLEHTHHLAFSAQCETVLISHSAFWRELLGRGQETLVRLAKKAKFDSVDGLLLVREPVDHAMSHYRQVVKVGRTVSRFDDWLASHYHYVDWLAELLTAPPEITWSVRKYEPANRPLDSVVFEDWIGLSTTDLKSTRAERPVNSSLTSDEAMCIVDLAAEIPGIHESLAPRFLALPSEDRPERSAVKDWMRDVASDHFYRQVADLNELNAFLRPDEKLLVPPVLKGAHSQLPAPRYELTASQISVVRGGSEEHLRLHGRQWRRYGVITSIRKYLADRAPRSAIRVYRMILRPVLRRLG